MTHTKIIIFALSHNTYSVILPHLKRTLIFFIGWWKRFI